MGAKREKLVKWVKSLSGVQKTLIGIVIALVAISILYQFDWSGFGKDDNKSETTKVLINPRTGEKIEFTEKTISHQSAKTLWDWLGLAGTIAIPFALFYFEKREQKRSEEKADYENIIAANNLNEQVLESYIDRMSELLIDKNLKILITKQLTQSDEEYVVLEAALDIARARTLSILRRLSKDTDRIKSVVKFLSDIELIDKQVFRDSDLSDLNLTYTNLENADLQSANLTYTNLSYADLSGANLESANLEGANLASANLKDTVLLGAKLEGANLSYANLSYANLKSANLEGANLASANLKSANLSYANLASANLFGANLQDANLQDAKNLTPEQVKKAKKWELAKYNDEFRAELGLPPNE